MSEGVKVALIGAGALILINAMSNLVSVYLQYLTHSKVKTLAHEMNSVREQLVKETGKAAHAKGMDDQREITKKEQEL